MDSSYGRYAQRQATDTVSRHVENISVQGFTIVEDILAAAELDHYRERIDALYARQETEFGREALAEIQELDVCRAPLLYDLGFADLARHPRVVPIVAAILGDWYILNLQNAIINRPGTRHHQSSWHRDLPYHDIISSRPLAINFLLVVDEFSVATGATEVVPFSHRLEILPSAGYIATNKISVAAPAGSGILFDAMLFHRAGANTSSIVRRAVNHLYTVPIIKQQVDFTRALGARPDLDPALLRLLGYDSATPLNEREWRQSRMARRRATAGNG